MANPFLPDYGTSFFPRLGLTADIAGQMAMNQPGELLTSLMEAQYGSGGSAIGGRFGAYLRNQARNLSTYRNLWEGLSPALGKSSYFNRGDMPAGAAYQAFEDLYESMSRGPGSGKPGEFSIRDFRDMLYNRMIRGGEGAETVATLGEPGSMAEAQNYLDQYLRPLLANQASDMTWNMLTAQLPKLFSQYSGQVGRPGGKGWAQWLVNQGYLPERAF